MGMWPRGARDIMIGRMDTRATEKPGPQQRDPDDEDDRKLANIVLVIGFVVLVAGGFWLANAMVDARKADECISSGRRNCIPLDVPARQ
jgi:hypothetical protein